MTDAHRNYPKATADDQRKQTEYAKKVRSDFASSY